MLSERVKSWEERWEEKGKAAGMEQGLQQGMEQGLQQGRKSGEQSLLTRQLIKRFGDVPEWAQQRLDAADTAQLESWGEKLLDAKSLQDVFD
jgi:flagellar biosynthesis/type III secretory pathway protein FliH